MCKIIGFHRPKIVGCNILKRIQESNARTEDLKGYSTHCKANEMEGESLTIMFESIKTLKPASIVSDGDCKIAKTISNGIHQNHQNLVVIFHTA